MTLNIVIKGRPITKKNNGEIVYIKGRPKILPSRRYREYARAALFQIPKDAKLNIDYPCNVKCVYFMPTKQKVDLTNLEEGTDDILTAAHVIKDDNVNIVATHDGSHVRYDKENPRVEIEIKPKAEGVE